MPGYHVDSNARIIYTHNGIEKQCTFGSHKEFLLDCHWRLDNTDSFGMSLFKEFMRTEDKIFYILR